MNILMFTFPAATYFAYQIMFIHTFYYVYYLPPCLIILLTVKPCLYFIKNTYTPQVP